MMGNCRGCGRFRMLDLESLGCEGCVATGKALPIEVATSSPTDTTKKEKLAWGRALGVTAHAHAGGEDGSERQGSGPGVSEPAVLPEVLLAPCAGVLSSGGGVVSDAGPGGHPGDGEVREEELPRSGDRGPNHHAHHGGRPAEGGSLGKVRIQGKGTTVTFGVPDGYRAVITLIPLTRSET